MKAVIRTLLSRPEIAALVMMLLLVVGFYSYAPVFLSTGNARIIFAIVPELGLVALGVTLLMISGEFDLSVGSMFAFGGLLPFVLVQSHGVDPWLGFVIATAAALVVGYINGFITITFGIPSFITTLGMLFIVRSAAVASVDLTGGFPPPWPKQMDVPDSVFTGLIAEGSVFRASFLWFVAVALILGWVLHRSNFGNWIFATGAHRQSAEDMGVDTRRVKLTCFMICSVLAAWGGIFQALRVHSALPTVGQGYELQAIAAAVIGGAALFGGFGSILGPIVGVFVIRILDNGLVMTRIDANYFKLAIGCLTILAVIFNVIVRRRAQRMRLEAEAELEAEAGP